MDKIKQIIYDLRIDNRGLTTFIIGKEEAIDKIHKYIKAEKKKMLKRVLGQYKKCAFFVKNFYCLRTK